jgi:N-glycosylase/DNA lyase
MKIIKELNELRNSPIKLVIDKKLNEFFSFQKKGNKEWFSELCFCLLTANTSAVLGLRIQKELGYTGFTDFDNEEELALRLKNVKYRFYNRRAHFIALANKFKKIKSIIININDSFEKREWLVNNIKGLGYKESSHFLRNVGFNDYAILDKHILRLMKENGLIKMIPKSISKKDYLKFEKILEEISKKVDMSQGEMDLYLWYTKTGKILK